MHDTTGRRAGAIAGACALDAGACIQWLLARMRVSEGSTCFPNMPRKCASLPNGLDLCRALSSDALCSLLGKSLVQIHKDKAFVVSRDLGAQAVQQGGWHDIQPVVPETGVPAAV